MINIPFTYSPAWFIEVSQWNIKCKLEYYLPRTYTLVDASDVAKEILKILRPTLGEAKIYYIGHLSSYERSNYWKFKIHHRMTIQIDNGEFLEEK